MYITRFLSTGLQLRHGRQVYCVNHENYIPGISVHTVDMERFAGLNICGFNPIEILAETLLCCVGQKCLLFSIIKVSCLYSQEKFDGTLENCENAKV